MTASPRYAIQGGGAEDWHSKQVVGDE